MDKMMQEYRKQAEDSMNQLKLPKDTISRLVNNCQNLVFKQILPQILNQQRENILAINNLLNLHF